MTRKPTLERWANGLSANLPASATVQELEQAIEQSIFAPTTTGITLGQGIRNNWAVLRSEVLPTVKAVAKKLRS